MPLVAHVVDGQHDRCVRPEGGGVRGSVHDIDTGASRRARESDERPSKVRRWMRRFRDVSHPGRQHPGIHTAERDELERLPQRQQRARQSRDVSPDTGRR